jgi:hypothetical protein
MLISERGICHCAKHGGTIGRVRAARFDAAQLMGG